MTECLDDLNNALPCCEVESTNESTTKEEEDNKINKRNKGKKQKPRGTIKKSKGEDGYKPQEAE